MNLKDFIATVPDFPKAGIMFRDVSPLLASPAAFHASIEGLAEKFSGVAIDKIVGFDARGFIFGAALALKLGVPFVMLRKKGKLPGDTVSVAYGLEYGKATLEIKRDAIAKGERVLFVDDLLATGGTALAGVELVEGLGGVVLGFAFVIELADLGARAKLLPHVVHALVSYDGDDA